MESLPRRAFLSTLAGVALLSGTTVALADGGPQSCIPTGPLTIGSRFGRWTIQEVTPHAGALLVLVKGEASSFTLEILARDDGSAVSPPAKTKNLAIFVRNGGNGNDPTDEDHGLAAITLAARLDRVGDTEIRKGLLTHRERLAHPDARR